MRASTRVPRSVISTGTSASISRASSTVAPRAVLIASMSAVVPLARVMVMSPATFDRSSSPLGADVDAARDALGLGLALVGAALALLREGGRGWRGPDPDSEDERENDH